MELWLSEVVNNKEDIRNMRSQGFRSNTNSIVGKAINYHYPQLDALVSMFDADKLWNKQIPSVVMGYFDDMHTLLSNLFEQTVEGGYVGIVIGNSVYSNTVIPSDSITARIAEDVGFEVDGIHVARHLTTSSQQKEIMKPLNSFLRESIVLLRK